MVECDVLADARLGFRNALVCVQGNLFVLERFPKKNSGKTLSRYAPLPSILKMMPWSSRIDTARSRSVNGEPSGVNYLHYSIRIDSFAFRVDAVIGCRRLRNSPRQHTSGGQSRTAKRSRKPYGMYVMSAHHARFGR
jgi:hypothetical protein